MDDLEGDNVEINKIVDDCCDLFMPDFSSIKLFREQNNNRYAWPKDPVAGSY